jgi:hypothetical protein
MVFVANVLNVFIASPGDTSEYRDAVEAALHRWNGMRAANSGIILLPRRWEVDGIPLMGGDGQSQLNAQLVDNADIVIGIFHTRLGRATPRSRSGTAEEIERTHAAGKPVHVYRATAPMPSDVDTAQVEELRTFLADMQKNGLTGSFATAEDLQNQVHAAIEHDLATMILPTPAAPRAAASHASLRAAMRKQSTSNYRLILTNTGDATARGVTLEMTPLTDGDAPELLEDTKPDLRPGDDFAFTTLMFIGVASSIRLTMTWQEEDGNTYTDEQTLSLF